MSSLVGHVTFCRGNPAPPPTVNALTSYQKAQLRRSTTKLAKMLGAAPQIVDDFPSPNKMSLPYSSSLTKRIRPTLLIMSSRASLHKRRRSGTKNIDVDRFSTNDTKIAGPYFTSQECLRPENGIGVRTEVVCDPMYEPSFIIPSSSKLRREKLARVCKLLGEDVPADLVFPTAVEDDDDHDTTLDIRPLQLPIIETPPPLPPKQVVLKSGQSKCMSQHTMTLETIVEQSPRSSRTSGRSTNSACSLLTTTTSSSYRFTSSVCVSSPSSFSSHETTETSCTTRPIYETEGTHGRREFGIYIPFQQRKSKPKFDAGTGKRGTQEFEVIRATVDLRI